MKSVNRCAVADIMPQDHRDAVAARRLEALERTRDEITRELESVSRQISVARHHLRAWQRRTGRNVRQRGWKARARLASIVADILGRSREPLSIEEIYALLMQDSRYTAVSSNLMADLKSVLEANEGWLFRKVEPGAPGRARR
ncbi:MAG: hypothetical protein AB1640_10965 [bacterium]